METLQNLCLDELIFSYHPDTIKSVILLPRFILELLDKRVLQVMNTEKYQKRFKILNK